eukprot:Pompholyxophrys_punicea_v1_NODE_846_length_1221_cov_2.827616.p1 type:complete len:193 gc:universal NODE_846_length_1221_cov_2.827616:639-1217(+)
METHACSCFRWKSSKRQNLERREKRDDALKQGLKLARQGEIAQSQKFLKQSVSRTPEMAHDIIEELNAQKMAIEYFTAPYEADAQLVSLCKSGYIDVVLGEDGDFIARGCPNVLTKLKNDGSCDMTKFSDVLGLEKFLHFSAIDFLNFCILSGCDYFKIPKTGAILFLSFYFRRYFSLFIIEFILKFYFIFH